MEQLGPEGKRIEEADIEKHTKEGLTFFSNRICPFAHRAWWTAEETGFADKWNYVHIDLGPTKPEWYKNSVNPFGTVPCLFEDGKPVFESELVAEFINTSAKGDIFPTDPHHRAAARLIATRFGENCIKPLYGFLMRGEGKEDAFKALEDVEALYVSQRPKDAGEGPFLLGANLSYAEIAMLPFIHRFAATLKAYRDTDLLTEAKIPKIKAALLAARERPAFKKTTPEDAFFVEAYKSYVKN